MTRIPPPPSICQVATLLGCRNPPRKHNWGSTVPTVQSPSVQPQAFISLTSSADRPLPDGNRLWLVAHYITGERLCHGCTDKTETVTWQIRTRNTRVRSGDGRASKDSTDASKPAQYGNIRIKSWNGHSRSKPQKAMSRNPPLSVSPSLSLQGPATPLNRKGPFTTFRPHARACALG